MTKIDKKNFPMLDWMTGTDLKAVKFLPSDSFVLNAFIREDFIFKSLLLLNMTDHLAGDTLAAKVYGKKLNPKSKAKQKRYYLADSIFNIIEFDKKVRDKLWELRAELPTEAGIIMARKGVQYVYRICDPVESRKFLDRRALFTLPRFPDNTRWFMIAFVVKNVFMGFECGVLDEKGPQLLQGHCVYHPECEQGQFISFVGITLLFLRHSEVETKLAGPTVPTGRRTVLNGEKYLNDTDTKVEFVDSTWFTTLVKSGAFNVKGHLRWQRVGPREVPLEERPKKLVNVKPFKKQGYTRKAKVLGLNPNAQLKPTDQLHGTN